MNDRYLHDLKKQWLLLLLSLAPLAGTRAQCAELPVFADLPAEVFRACSDFADADINAVPPGTVLCYRVDGTTGTPVPGSLNAGLRAALLSGGGVPRVTSACAAEVEVCVADLASGNDECDDRQLTRRYLARNTGVGNDNTPVVATQTLTFVRPELTGLTSVETAVFLVPDNGQGIPQNPPPRAQDYPTFRIGDDVGHLTEACGLSVTYQDGERRNGCGNNFRFLRTYRVEDACANGTSQLFTQTVKVGDQEERLLVPPPAVEYPIVFGVNNACGAVVDTRATGITVRDLCNGGGGGLNAYVYLDGRFDRPPLGPYLTDSEQDEEAMTDPLPVGNHVIRYVGQDSYGAATVLDIDIRVSDQTPPSVRCGSGVSVTLDASGRGQITATALDGGTVDLCGAFSLAVARADTGGNPSGPYAERLVFDCQDLGGASVVVRATDEAGNHSRCNVVVAVTDASPPQCLAPPATALTCRAFAENFPTDLTAFFNEQPEVYGPLLDQTFGAGTGLDNCGVSTVSQAVEGQLSNCGTGRFTRRFTVADEAGFTQATNCRQFIDVRPYFDYSLLMPADQQYTCAELPTQEDLVAGDTGCDLLVVTTEVDTLPTDESACYRLSLTHRVINWCEYDGASAALEIPRDADGDGTPGQRVGLHVLARDGATLTDDVAMLDRDFMPGSGNEIGYLLPNYAASGRRGHFTYQQIISLTDNTPPVTDLPAQEDGQAFTNLCLGGVVFRFTATDDCVTPTLEVAVDVTATDRNGDGRYDAPDFAEDRQIAASQFFPATGGGTEVFIRNLPIGQHLARLRVTDDCGNLEERFSLLNVVDNRAPTPACRTINSVSLGADPDFGGIATVYATDFITGPADVCTEAEVTYAVFSEEEASAPGFFPRNDQRSVTYDCSDVGEQLLRVYAFSVRSGRYDFCNVALVVRSGTAAICAGREGSAAGVVVTEAGQPMTEVEVFLTPLDGSAQRSVLTEDNGGYAFDGLLENRGYDLQPYLNDDPNNGVETFDISQVSALLTNGNYEDFTPYQLIAADANNSGNITVVDLLSIRAVVLGIEDAFPNNTSWRFVPTEHEFPVPTNPWAATFPEAYPVRDLSGHVEADFIAIKVGDVNNTATPSGLNGSPPTTEGRGNATVLSLVPSPVAVGVYELTLPAGSAPAGVQFSMLLPPGGRVLSAQDEALGFVVDRNNVLKVVYVPTTISSGQPFLSLYLPEATDAASLSLSGGDLPAFAFTEAGDPLPLRLAAAVGSAVPAVAGRVYPNPARDRATLSFGWPKEEMVDISIFDARGQRVHTASIQARTSENHYVVERADLGFAPGAYVVSVAGGTGTMTLKMMVVE